VISRIVAGAVLALVLCVVGALFGLNGPTWDWWQDVAWGAALVTLVAVPLAGPVGGRMPTRMRRFRGLLLSLGTAGLVVLVATLAAMGAHFNDSYTGSLAWPRVLACVGSVGYVMALAAAALLSNAGKRPA
jgi:amino acid permease